MKHEGKNPAFTLLEMIIAITVFTIFVGFAISTYLSFHRADQEALEERSLMFEIQGAMDLLAQAVRENQIDYSAYSEDRGTSFDVLKSFSARLPLAGLGKSHVIKDDTLFLVSPNGEIHYVYTWDEDEGTLSLQAFDSEGGFMPGYEEPVRLHGESTQVTYAGFRVFPDVNPYDRSNALDDEIQYQPTVQIQLRLSVPGRVRQVIEMELQTSVTSRFYQ